VRSDVELADYLERREALIRDAVPGIEPARRLALLTDDMLAQLARAASSQVPAKTSWALVALGGYGAGALLPGSDLDLLVLTDGSPSQLKPFVEAILYPLWDAGLKLGHQVRDRRDQLRATREELATLTSALTGRFVAGDEQLAREVLHACARDSAKRERAVLDEIQGRPREGSPYLLEPDLKEGAGGRRDYDELTWTAAVLTGTVQSDPRKLVGLGIIGGEELGRLEAAASLTAAARWELQKAGAGQLMTLDLAAELGTDPQLVQNALADTHHLLELARRRTRHADVAPTAPLQAQELFRLAGQGDEGRVMIESLAWSGRLEHLTPGIASLMPLRRPGLAHTLSVGAHCVAAACAISSIGTTIDAGSVAAASARAIADKRTLIAAALVHDIGKTLPGPGHAERGEPDAYDAALRLGLAKDEARSAASLVRNHLLLVETATRCDLDDEDAMLAAAEALGRQDLLAPLHLLTIADSMATGPGAWNEWTAALIGKLVTRLDVALSPEVDGAGIAAAARHVRESSLAALAPHATAERAFVTDAPLRYLAGREVKRVLEQANLVAQLAEERMPGAHVLRVDPGPLDGSFVLTVAARDRHGLLATIAGVMALSGLDILAVDALATGAGVALDTFTVRSATLAHVSDETWSRFERLLDAALRDRLSIGVRLTERRRHYHSGSTGIDRVDVLPGDPYAAALRIRATDRPGLLYDIARAMADSGLEIRSMTATTRWNTADDVFRVTDASGDVPEEGLIGMLRMRLRELG